MDSESNTNRKGFLKRAGLALVGIFTVSSVMSSALRGSAGGATLTRGAASNTRQGAPMTRQGAPMTRESAPMTRESAPMTRESAPMSALARVRTAKGAVERNT